MIAATVFAVVAALLIPAGARADGISIVGSSTVYPFMKSVVDQFQKTSAVEVSLEATGTEAGFSYFCAGSANYLPDINNASYPMTRRQRRICERNGVRDIGAFLIGFDGVVAVAEKNTAITTISKDDLYRALVAQIANTNGFSQNKIERWSEISPSLPDTEIKILGPPPTSGTRLFIEESFLLEHCLALLDRESGTQTMNRTCAKIRTDGRYVDVGEDDQFIIDAVTSTPNAVGLVGYGQYRQSMDRVKAIAIDGISPDFDNIESGAYLLSRPLFVYVKFANARHRPEIVGFLTLLLDQDVSGPDGSLRKMGLVPASAAVAAENQTSLATRREIVCPSIFCQDVPAN